MDFSKQSLLWLANMVLAVIVVMLAVKSVNIWFYKSKLPEVEKADKLYLKQTTRVKTSAFFQAESAFDSVATLNLFSPKRQEMVPKPEPSSTVAAPPPNKVAEAKEELIIAGEKIELYGVVFASGGKKALLKSRLFKDKPRNYQWFKIGSKIDGLEVLEIDKEQILIKAGQTLYPLKLYRGEMNQMAYGANSASRQDKKQFHQVVLDKPADRSLKAGAKKKDKTYKKPESDADEEWEIYRTPLGITKRRKTK